MEVNKKLEYKKVNFLSTKKRLVLGVVIGILLMELQADIINYIFFNNTLNIKLYRFIYLILILIPVHEILHILFFPSLKKVVLKISPKHFLVYIKYPEEISRKRFLIITIMPFLTLSILLMSILFYIKNEYIFYFIIFNTAGSGIDLISFYIGLSLPRNSIIKMEKTGLYYREKSFL